jgi:dTDP-4-dehydrorhamnose reductase
VNIVVTGGAGQLGRAVARRGPVRGHSVSAVPRAALDLSDDAAIARALDGGAPDAVINAAAYTAVDRAEREPALAFAVNADGAGRLARACAERDVALVHVSTDYVFDGTARTPYREDDPLAPLGVYGETKAAGERAVAEAGGRAVIARTSWVFSGDGANFVKTILRLAAERPVLRVVDDQLGCPTWADDLADAALVLAERAHARAPLEPIYHVAGAGPVTWHGFALAIVAEARRHRAVACERVEPITTAEFPTPARRPAYSVLDTARLRELGVVPPPWTIGLARVVAELVEARP